MGAVWRSTELANAGDRGLMVSHGCVRVYNEDMLDLKRVPLGTPVIIKT